MTPKQTSSSRPRYGALELKQDYRKGLTAALATAVCLHLAAIGGLRLGLEGSPESAMDLPLRVDDGVVRLFPIELPKEIFGGEDGPGGAGAIPEKVREGIPVPVDDEVITDLVLPTRLERLEKILGWQPGTNAGPPTARSGESGFGELEAECLPPIGDFTPTTQLPVIAFSVQPVYPREANQYGIEADLTLRILVDSKGDVRRSVVIDSSGLDFGFEEAATTAVLQWKFKPALQGDHPVAVWINVPVKFRKSR